MNFLNRVLAPGLRRVGPPSGPAAPMKAEPLLEEIVEEGEGAPTEALSVQPEAVRSPKEDRLLPHSGAAEKRPSIEPFDRPERPVPRPFQKTESFFEREEASTSQVVPPFDRPSRPEASSAAGERPTPGAEILSFESIAFDPAVPPAMRRFQPPGAQRRENATAASSESDRPDRSAREIVWEVVSTGPPSQGDSPFPHKREARREESSPSEAPSRKEPVNPGVSDPMRYFLLGNLSPQRERKEEARPGPIPKRPAGSIPPRPDSAPKEEKGDLIIEQMEVRVVAEPDRRPEPAKPRPQAPKRSGAWETATRYYLGKV